jgi:cobalt-zinc-cadmium efflux system outer membrane protein
VRAVLAAAWLALAAVAGAAGAVASLAAALVVREAAAADRLTLEEALARAHAASPAVRAAEAEVEAARGRLRQARLLPSNPVVSADLTRHTTPDADALDRGVELEQVVVVGAQRGPRRGAAEH